MSLRKTSNDGRTPPSLPAGWRADPCLPDRVRACLTESLPARANPLHKSNRTPVSPLNSSEGATKARKRWPDVARRPRTEPPRGHDSAPWPGQPERTGARRTVREAKWLCEIPALMGRSPTRFVLWDTWTRSPGQSVFPGPHTTCGGPGGSRHKMLRSRGFCAFAQDCPQAAPNNCRGFPHLAPRSSPGRRRNRRSRPRDAGGEASGPKGENPSNNELGRTLSNNGRRRAAPLDAGHRLGVTSRRR